MQEATIVCKNCGNRFNGKFCNNCGEKVYTEHDKTFGHFLGETFHFFTHLDNKFFRSWWLVITKPAVVSFDVVNGIRKRYFPPINLFLFGVVLYLLFPFLPGLNMPLETHRYQVHGPITNLLIKKKMESKHLTLKEVEERFDHKSPGIAKVMLFIIIPFTALVLQLLFSKKWFFFDHITLASEINTFYIFLTFFIVPLFFTIIFSILKLFNSARFYDIGDAITIPVYCIVFGAYCTRAFQRFYGAKKWAAILKSVLFLLCHAVVVYIIYKFLLMCVVFLFV